MQDVVGVQGLAPLLCSTFVANHPELNVPDEGKHFVNIIKELSADNRLYQIRSKLKEALYLDIASIIFSLLVTFQVVK
ncbi:MAG TPA: hypothetical protein V6D14_32010 [Coleofasciculaceae cyanobacterium]